MREQALAARQRDGAEAAAEPVQALQADPSRARPLGQQRLRALGQREERAAEVVVVAGAGHFLQLEQPDVVNRLIVDWVTAS